MNKKVYSDDFHLIEDPKVIELGQTIKNIMVMYNCALKEVSTKFEVLNEDLHVKYNRSSISSITSRLKSVESIVDKLQRKGLDITIENATKYLNDIAGIRVVCSFISDIYEIAEMLTTQDDITVLEVKDYIKNPKKNGYRSLHILVSIPVFFAKERKHVTVEVQLRTIAMDFWASLEHQIYYKKDFEHAEKFKERLKKCADQITELDKEMEEINKELAKYTLE